MTDLNGKNEEKLKRLKELRNPGLQKEAANPFGRMLGNLTGSNVKRTKKVLNQTRDDLRWADFEDAIHRKNYEKAYKDVYRKSGKDEALISPKHIRLDAGPGALTDVTKFDLTRNKEVSKSLQKSLGTLQETDQKWGESIYNWNRLVGKSEGLEQTLAKDMKARKNTRIGVGLGVGAGLGAHKINEHQKIANEIYEFLDKTANFSIPGKLTKLTEEEAINYLKMIKKKHDLESNDFILSDKVNPLEAGVLHVNNSGDQWITPKEAIQLQYDEKDVKNFRQALKDFDEAKDTLVVPQYKEIILHELGHVADPDKAKHFEIADKIENVIPQYATSSTILGSYLVSDKNPSEEDSVMDKGQGVMAGLGLTGLGAGAAYWAGKTYEASEDRANKFVKDTLTEELGSRALAEKTFKESVLPYARKTYSDKTRAMVRDNRRKGIIGTAIGASAGGLTYLYNSTLGRSGEGE